MRLVRDDGRSVEITLGQFTPPMIVNLMVSCRIARVCMEQSVPWLEWLLLAIGAVMLLVMVFPQLALRLAQRLSY